MKRKLFKLALFLLLGAIANFVVAWGCVAWSERNWGKLFYVETPTRQESNTSWTAISVPGEILSIKSYGIGVVEVWTARSEGQVSRGAIEYPESDSGRIEKLMFQFGLPFSSTMQCAGGWPALALIGEQQIEAAQDFAAKQNNRGQIANTKFAIPIPQDYTDFWFPRILPLRPIWPGFAFNTCFYAGILWLLTLGPFTTRRIIRRKRGLCIKCGYDLRDDFDSGCPECGWGREAEG